LDRVKIEDKAAIIGGGTVGCEVAIFLAERGVDVTLLEMFPYVAHGIPRLVGKMMKDMMIELGVDIMTNRRVVHISEEQVIHEDPEKKRASLPVAQVVLAMGSKPRNDLARSLKDLVGENYLIGDCLEPRRALEAISEGAEVGLRL
ncbi:MAG: FAD-dependent oxidoreductase, partial [Desulfatiglandaceae bacterium]